MRTTEGGSAASPSAALSSASWLAILTCALPAACRFATGFVYTIGPDVHLCYANSYRGRLVGHPTSWAVDQVAPSDTLAAAAVALGVVDIFVWKRFLVNRRRSGNWSPRDGGRSSNETWLRGDGQCKR